MRFVSARKKKIEGTDSENCIINALTNTITIKYVNIILKHAAGSNMYNESMSSSAK